MEYERDVNGILGIYPPVSSNMAGRWKIPELHIYIYTYIYIYREREKEAFDAKIISK